MMYYYLNEVDRFTGENYYVIFKYRDDGAVVSFPPDKSNSDYLAYEAWLTEGNVPEEWNPDASN